MKNLANINLNEVKNILDNAIWSFQYCSKTAGSDIEKACYYLDTQKFSINKIKEFLDHANDCETDEQVAISLAGVLADDRILKFLYCSTKPNGWDVDESTYFTIVT